MCFYFKKQNIIGLINDIDEFIMQISQLRVRWFYKNIIQRLVIHQVQQLFRAIQKQQSQLMKQLFFEKGHKEEFSPNGQWLCQTSSNLDSKKYLLQRVPFEVFAKQQNYIQNHFYFSRHDNLISYFTCWKEVENVQVEKAIPKEKDKKKDKKTMLDIMKRKTKIETEHSVPQSKKKINDQTQGQHFTQQEFVYVQMEYFSEVEAPNDFTGARDLMGVIYLLGKRIERQTGWFPCLIPVKNEENDRIKFFKKGLSEQTQLYKLMIYLFRERQEAYLREWSETLEKAIHKSMINRDELLIGSLLRNAIEEYIGQPHTICLFKEQQKMSSIQTVRIIDHQTLILEQSQIQLPLNEYSIQYLLKSQNDREITLTHEVFEKYTLSGKKNNFIVKWLFNMAT